MTFPAEGRRSTEVLKVSSRSNPNSVAGAMAGVIRQIGSVEVKSGQSSGQPREIWRWFTLLALIVLLIEWYIYNRRVYV